MSGKFLLKSCFVEISELKANSVSAAFDLGLHCLSTSLLWDARLKWVKPMSLSCLIFSQSDYLINIYNLHTYLMTNSADPDQLASPEAN